MNWTFIRSRKPSMIVAAMPKALALIAAVAILVTVGVVLTGTGFVAAALRQKSRREKALSNRYMLPEGYIDFNSRPDKRTS